MIPLVTRTLVLRLLSLSATLVVVASGPAQDAKTVQDTKTVHPLRGKGLEHWTVKSPDKNKWAIANPKLGEADPKTLVPAGARGTPALANFTAKHGGSSDIFTKARFGDCHVELELMVPKDSNSGIYLMGEYEIQVLDSYGREKLGMGDMGAIYGATAPSVNASKAPGEWQKNKIDFRAPRIDKDGKKIANAMFLRVELNGVVLHANVEMKGPTPGGLRGKEAPEGPLMFQGDHGPVAYRNISITPTVAHPLAIPATDDGLPGTGPIRRYDWFRNLWLQKRTKWAASAEKDREAVVFLGDSITQGWGDNMGNAFSHMKVANRGISGDTTRGMLIRLREDVLDLHPRAVVLLMGTNDLEERAKPVTIANNVALILRALETHNPKMPIILCKVFPSAASKRRAAKDIREINRLYAAAVQGNPRVTLLDTWRLFANEDGDAKKAEFPDLLHPNQRGYDMWAAALRPILATLGFLETEADDFAPEAGFRPLFNGTDLSGWGTRRGKTLERESDFAGKRTSPDGRYLAKHGRLIVTTPPEGRRVQQLWTTREFDQDFVLKLEFRATPNADSGVFVRGKQLQCRDYRLAGPYRQLQRYRPQDWNELVITVSDGVAHCTCNGETLEAAMQVPSSGPIGLEGDRGQVEYRRIRIATKQQ